MEVLTAKATRRSTRLRVEIPVTITSLDRVRPFSEKCMALVISAQGCGLRISRALAPETPLLLAELPGGGSTSGRVASCLPLGNDGKSFLVGVALYNHGNVWGIANPPDDWKTESETAAGQGASVNGAPLIAQKQSWPYNVFSKSTEADLGRK